MPVSRSAVACAGAAGALAAVAVAGQRVGLALSVTLLLVIGAGLLAAERRPAIPAAVLAVALAAQPALWDAGWVVAADVVASLVAAAVAVQSPGTWRHLGSVLRSPFRLVGGGALIARAGRSAATAVPGRHVRPVVRGAALGLALMVVFGWLFATADEAFADLVGRTFAVQLDAADIVWRVLLGVLFATAAGALGAAAARAAEPAGAPAWAPGLIELRIALTAVVGVFAVFVAVQLHVLFGGAAYVQETTGLGYGEYARQGFVQLLAVAGLTLALVGVAARRPDRAVRGLLGVLCVLTLVVLLSAHHRLELVEDAYGLTRVRYAGHAMVAWFAVMFGLVLAAGLRPGLARGMPRTAAAITLAGVLAFSVSNPDGRIAESAVDRAASGRSLDVDYLSGLSADGLPALERLPEPARSAIVLAVRKRLARPDALAGANLSRARGR